MTVTFEQKKALLNVLKALASTIQELGAVPSGHLYAMLMDRLSLQEYEAMIDILVRSDVVKRESSHLLVWVGPKNDVSKGATTLVMKKGE